MRWPLWWPWRRAQPATHADLAVSDSAQRLHEARQQTSLVEELAGKLRDANQLNRYAARIAAAYRDRR